MGRGIKIAKGLADDSPARSIRHEVFELEQHIPDEFDEADEIALHAVLYLDGEAVACARGFLEEAGDGGHGCADDSSGAGGGNGDTWHLGRFAVLKPYRRQGLGSLVLKALEEAAQTHGAQSFVLDAQLHAAPFYRAHGYTPITDIYEICGYPHVTMRKTLDGPHTP
jgi:predicted GNAT family N-acyltransferase